MSGQKPLLVFTAASPAGHTGPMLFIAKTMIDRGYEGIFMTTPAFKDNVAKIGASFWETKPFWSDEALITRLPLEYGLVRLKFDLEHVFHKAIPDHHKDMKALLESVRDEQPGREVIIVTEMASVAVLPWHYGAPLPKGFDELPKIIGINVIPLMVTSMDAGPFGTGLPPDATQSGRERNKLLHQLFQTGPFKDLDDLQKDILHELGCTTPKDDMPFFLDAWMSCYDALLQVCGPSMEPPRSDLPAHIRCIGPLPKRSVDPTFPFPSWWSELESNSKIDKTSPSKKNVVLVSQGTVAIDYPELLYPTIKAFESRNDILLIVVLGVKGAQLPSDVAIPPNTRVVDYIPYDAVLPHVDVFVNNASYGAQTHAVNHGVPMVEAGETEDKFEVAALTEWAGFAVNLRTQRPTVKQIYDGVDKVLGDPRYKRQALRLKQEGEDLDSLATIQRQIETFTKPSGTA